MTDPVVVGVDVGGTKVMAGVVSPEGVVSDLVHGVTPAWPGPRTETHRLDRELVAESVVEVLLAAVAEAAGDAPVAAVGVAAAGFVDAAGRRVRFAPHLPWRGEDVHALLTDRLGVPVMLDNDANCAAYAEWRLGAARGRSGMLMVTLGTGIGGGVVLDDRLYRGRGGMAGEFGHMQVVPNGAACECGGNGCWEQYCSGNALVRFVRTRLGSVPSILGDWCEGDPERLTGPMVTAAAADGDELAVLAFASIGEWLGVGVANLVAAFDPDIVVIGGGVSAAGDLLLAPGRSWLSHSLVGAHWRDVPPMEIAAFGPRAGLIGAAELARASLSDPARHVGPASQVDGAAPSDPAALNDGVGAPDQTRAPSSPGGRGPGGIR